MKAGKDALYRATIDFGNTYGKVGIFYKDELIKVYSRLTASDVKNCLQNYVIEEAIICNVGENKDFLTEELLTFIPFVMSFNHKTSLPIHNLYTTPHTLGLDRLAGVMGAKVHFPEDACLVIDMGTCVTFDFIDEHNQYHGGSISPGLSMRFKALEAFTARLPLCSTNPEIGLIGNSTEQSIQSGVYHGLKAEIIGIIQHYQEKFGKIKVILCGGDGIYFEKALKPFIFADYHLIHYGLNRILRTNEKNL
ncbi:type III pantothenate kinase [Algivirga pacifica]|uniref:Type III pantothenate kinase n=2 Tax=Algivirga pacifica TaxID=1162670 RepID=A0ABP9DMD4_9BACT